MWRAQVQLNGVCAFDKGVELRRKVTNQVEREKNVSHVSAQQLCGFCSTSADL